MKKSHLIFFGVLVLLLLLPQSWVQGLRTVVSAALTPSWILLASKPKKADSTFDAIRQEKLALQEQLKQVKEWLLSQEYLDAQQRMLHELRGPHKEEHALFFKRREEALVDRLDLLLHSIQGRVIYRDPTHWNQLLWVDVGERDNRRLGVPIIRKNSPVISHGAAIGVVEKVHESRSLIRLITDPILVLSVRVSRGNENAIFLLQEIDHLLDELHLFPEYNTLVSQIGAAKRALEKRGINRYLAKGEVRGMRLGSTLKGEGFNYDYADEEGPALDLVTGKPIDASGTHGGVPLIQEGDLLITTGYDGIFPQGFPVAWVKTVHPLIEGGITYTIDALACAHFDSKLEEVIILPSLSGDL